VLIQQLAPLKANHHYGLTGVTAKAPEIHPGDVPSACGDQSPGYRREEVPEVPQLICRARPACR